MSAFLRRVVSYFDLNSGAVRINAGVLRGAQKVVLGTRLNAEGKPVRTIMIDDHEADEALTGSGDGGSGGSMAPGKSHSFFQWFALFLGVAVQPYFVHYQTKQTFRDSVDHPWEWLAFAMITAVIVFPAIYRRAFTNDTPVWLQMIPIFTAGLGWNSLLATAIKAGQATQQ